MLGKGLGGLWLALTLLAAACGPTPGLPASPPPSLRPFGETGLAVPAGFAVRLYYAGLTRPASLAYDPRGRLFVATQGGDIAVLEDQGGRGVRMRDFATGFNQPLGLAFRGREVYVSSRGRVTALRDEDDDGVADSRRDILTGLPSGRHQNNGLAFGPDGRLYVTSGSATNAGPEPSDLNATILRLNPDGSGLEIFARGLRNPYDLAFTSGGDLFATDNGADPPAFLAAPDELNLIKEGGHYGYPQYAGNPPAGSGTIAPVVNFQPYSSSDGLAYYGASAFPMPYREGFFVAQYGANSGDPAIGKRVVWVALARGADGYEGRAQDFATGLRPPPGCGREPRGRAHGSRLRLGAHLGHRLWGELKESQTEVCPFWGLVLR